MRTSFGLRDDSRRSRIRRLGTVGRVNVGGRNRVGALGGYWARAVVADRSDPIPIAAECPVATRVLVPDDDSPATSVGGAGNSSGTSAMLSPACAPAARRSSPN